MDWITSLATPLAYLFLFLTVILLWVPNKSTLPYWSITLLLALLTGFIGQPLQLIAFPFLFLFAIAIYYHYHTSIFILKSFTGILIFLFSIGFLLHQIPGFNALTVLDQVRLSKDALPYTLNLHFDKPIMGILILGVGHSLIDRKKEWGMLLNQLALKTPCVILSIIVLSLLLGFVQFDFKLPESLLIWMFSNLLFTSVAEEAFFRGFVQEHLYRLTKKMKGGAYFAILMASIFFGLTHYPGGLYYVLLATAAGIGYGWIYYKTQRIEGAILTHFGLNLTHFIFFTYPALSH